MSVITHSEHDPHHSINPQKVCSICGNEPYYPFMSWTEGANGLCLCGSCCSKWRRGLILDIMQCAVAYEMYCLDHDVVLERETKLDIETRAKRKREEIVRLVGDHDK